MGVEWDRPLAEQTRTSFGEAYKDLEKRTRAVVNEHVLPREHEETDEAGIAMTRALGEAGILDAGVNLDVASICVVRDIVASASGLADSMVALQGLGYGPIALAGTDAHKEEWGEKVRQGQAIAAIGITEPEAGSDVASIQTTATKDGSEYVLNGKKCFITNAGIADFYVVVARTGEPGSRGLSTIIVPASAVSETHRYDLVAPHPCGELVFDNARVPVENRIGDEGQGFKIAMRTLDHFRPTVGAAANGMAARALDEARLRSKKRQQFGKPIAQFQQLQAYLADSWTELMAGRLLVARAATAHSDGDSMASLYSSAAKMFATEAAQRIIDRAVQIHGGSGVLRGTVVERLYREIRALRIYEGTTEIQKLVLSRGILAD